MPTTITTSPLVLDQREEYRALLEAITRSALAELQLPVTSDLDGSESGEWYRFYTVPIAGTGTHAFIAVTQHHGYPAELTLRVETDADHDQVPNTPEVTITGELSSVIRGVVQGYLRGLAS